MNRAADVVVIGGGVIGTSVAFHLTQSGVRHVTLLERDYIGAGATGRSHSIIRCHYTNPHDTRLALASLPYWSNWNDLVGHGDPAFARTGVLRFVSEADVSKLRRNVEMLRDVGVDTWLINSDEVREIDVSLSTDDIALAAWEPEAGYADALAVARGFASAAEALGAQIKAGERAIRILTSGNHVTGVETSTGVIATDRVVVANGSWAPALLEPLGFSVRLVPKRVQIVSFLRSESRTPHEATLFDGALGIVVRGHGSQDTLVALGFDPDPVDPDTFDEGLERDYIATCRERFIRRRPGMSDAPARGGWIGVAPETPDGHIILDQLPGAEGCFVAVGCSGTNFKTAPAIGLALSEWITGGAPKTIDLHPFRSTRFAENDPIRGIEEYGEGGPDVWR